MEITSTIAESFTMLPSVRLDPDTDANRHEADGIAYSMASHPAKAMKAYEKAHAWRELFTVAKEQQLDDQAIAAMVERVTGQSIPSLRQCDG